ncbi:MAG: selenocysteine-specific translation elongation factor [Candidatus Omnitrophota bacterium]|nr:selenocysteine-specific translation elongation factor [Candidatus Omnitrophota bacterium]
MKHLIMGTAGHVDHGKTALIKALTGIDCDTHPEEKRRGITINLGFAYYDLPDKSRLGIIDVPGHRNFVHTMVGGAAGIDFFLLVIAANSGIMPQTREHVRILEMFGIKKGVIALNKIDLIDDELLLLNLEEIGDFFKNTLFTKFPIIGVSAKTGSGINDLKQSIFNVCQEVEEREPGEIFRMYIDRIFTAQGFGTVVTGTVLGGTLCQDTKVYLLPWEKELRVRRMEHHGKEEKEVRAGDRAAINLVGLERGDFSRGMIISDRVLETSTMVDAKCVLFDSVLKLKLWSSALFLCGTNETQCRIHLLDCDQLNAGEEAIVQIVFSKPIVVFNGDRFILRNTSSDMTIGGGVIIDAHPLHHRRRTEKMEKEVKKRLSGTLPELIASETRKRYRVISHKEIADILNISAEKIFKAAQDKIADDIFVFTENNEAGFLLINEYKRIKGRLIKRFESVHKDNPYDEKGMTFESCVSAFGFKKDCAGEMFIKHLLSTLENDNFLKKVTHTWSLKSHSVTLTKDMEKEILFVEDYLKNSGFKPPLMSELIPFAKSKRFIHETKLRQILHYLVKQSTAYEIEGNFIHSSIVNTCREKMVKALECNPEGMTVSQFRDLIKGNRKICLLLLSQYDYEGIVVRRGDVRVLADKHHAFKGSEPPS